MIFETVQTEPQSTQFASHSTECCLLDLKGPRNQCALCAFVIVIIRGLRGHFSYVILLYTRA